MADGIRGSHILLTLCAVLLAVSGCGCDLLDGFADDSSRNLNPPLRYHEAQPLVVISVNTDDRTVVLSGGRKAKLEEGMVVVLSRANEDYGRAKIRHVFRNTATADIAPGITPAVNDTASVLGNPADRSTRRKGNVVRSDAGKPYLIDLGAADGVRQGMLFTVSRAGEYVGVLSVIDAYEDLSAARAVDGMYDIRIGDLIVERGTGEDALMPHKEPLMAPMPKRTPPGLGEPGYAPYPQR